MEITSGTGFRERSPSPILPYLLLSFGGAHHVRQALLLTNISLRTGPENKTLSHSWASRTSAAHCHLLRLPSGCFQGPTLLLACSAKAADHHAETIFL